MTPASLSSLLGPEAASALFEPITGSGSPRSYWRITLPDSSSLIGVVGTDRAENEAFIYLDRHFRSKQLPVPRIIAVSADNMAYLQEDLGSVALFDVRDNMELLSKTLKQLARLHFEGAQGLDWHRCYPVPEMDRRSIMWDLNYFKYCYLKLKGIHIDEPLLEEDFEALADSLLTDTPMGFMMRDCQSRNVMIKADEPYFIDFQGGRRGPVLYDLASFLWQARAGFSPEQRDRLIEVYAEAAGLDASALKASVGRFVIFRMLQVLGAYGLRGLHEGKEHFIRSIPPALKTLRSFLPEIRQPYLHTLIEEITRPDPLTVEVLSFSYKRGMPADSSGNGGGFIFDCRAIHNPGRYDEYKSLTGLDAPVIEFLEKDGEILGFLEHCRGLVFPAVQTYLRRGFTHLQVAFGCTGGQHRSAYCASHMAQALEQTFGAENIRITCTHREQPYWP